MIVLQALIIYPYIGISVKEKVISVQVKLKNHEVTNYAEPMLETGKWN